MAGLKNPWEKGGRYYPGWDSKTAFAGSEAPENITAAIGIPESCDISLLNYTGLPELKSTRSVITNDDLAGAGDQDKMYLVFMLGIVPRSPTEAEYKSVTEKFPLLQNACWWITDDQGQGAYNCYSYCMGRLQIMDNINKGIDPSIALHDAGSVHEDFEEVRKFFSSKGLHYTTDLNTPSPSIASFQDKHTAWRSSYQYSNTVLWESKLGYWGSKTETVRILHFLKDLEGGPYGNINGYFTK
jgi:hypothetical protein